jgi:hypothetical protein
MDLDRPHRLTQLKGLARPGSGSSERRQQALDRRQQEVTRAKRRLEDPPGVQRPSTV